MINIELPTGKTITMTAFEYYFMLEEDEIDIFYQSCIADDLGVYIDDPFSNKIERGKLEVEEIPDVADEDSISETL